MNRKKGFTLIELIAVISILGVIATLATTIVYSVIDAQRKKLVEDQVKSLKDAAITYYMMKEKKRLKICSDEQLTNIENIAQDCSVSYDISTLIGDGFFENTNGLCNADKKVIVYKIASGTEAYVEEDACSY